MKKIIGFTGQKQSGKDSACDSLEDYTKISFAEPMREMLKSFCASPMDFDYEENKEDDVLTLFQTTLLRDRVEKSVNALLGESNPKHCADLYLALVEKFGDKEFSARDFLKYIGTDWARNTIDKDIWVKAAMQKAHTTEGNVAFSDVRFDNEAECIKHSNGVIVHLSRPGQDTQDDHESENGISEELVDHFIVAKDLEELQNKVAVADATYDLILTGEGGEIEEISNAIKEVNENLDEEEEKDTTE